VNRVETALVEGSSQSSAGSEFREGADARECFPASVRASRSHNTSAPGPATERFDQIASVPGAE